MTESDSNGSPDRLGPGSKIAHYEIVRELGRGGMGVVFEALDLKLERRVALKTPLGGEAINIKRFMREGRAASQILHPNVVSVLDVFNNRGIPFMAMELIEGETLGDKIERAGPFSTLDILKLTEGLADALCVAHDKGVLHRDIKPSNILLDSRGVPRLTDFGLARFLEQEQADQDLATRSLSLTAAGTQPGTLAYMSPEQVLGKQVGPQSDVFSLGAVMYEMCTGRRAFPADTHGEILDAVLHHEPDAIARFNYELPEDLERVIRKALAKRADERYQTSHELMVDLRSLRRRIETGEHSAPSQSILESPPRRRRWISAVLTTVAVAAVAVTAWKMMQPAPVSLPPTLGSPLRLTHAEGWSTEPAVSPDGQFVAFTSNQSGNSDIWIVDARGGEPLRLTDDPAADRSPAWFPDRSAVAFVSERSGIPSIWKTPVLGGTESLLVPGALDPAISPDGSRIAFSRSIDDGPLRIAVAPIDDPTDVVVLTGPDDGLWSHTNPRWSPDGESLCYADFRDLWIVGSRGGKPRPLTADDATDRDPIWSRDGKAIVFSSLREGNLALWWMPVDGGEPSRLTLGTGPERFPSFSRDGTQLAYSTFGDDSDIVILDRRSGNRTRLTTLSSEGSPTLSPDNSALVFDSDRRGRWDLWIQPLESGRPAGEPRLLVEQPGSFSGFSFSPDGRWLAYMRVHDQQRDIWIVDVAGGLPVRFTQSPAMDIHPAWSPDGSRIAFISNRSGGESLWVKPVVDGRAAGEAVPVTRDAAADVFPAWSPDGTLLALIRDGGDLWVVSPDSPYRSRRLIGDVTVWRARWEPSGKTLLVDATWDEDAPEEIRPVSVENGGLEGPGLGVDFGQTRGGLAEFDVSRDGTMLVFVEGRTRGDIWITRANPSGLE